jgi:ABC-type antimicrobial peptide transport system permease subunit
MRTAMGVLTAAALLLATLGFAAATTALATQRRQEGVVLTALGYSPRAQRRVLLVERTVVVALTAIVGLAVAALSSWLVMPLLVSGDGHAQVPPVVLAFNWPALLILVAGVSAVLVAVAALLVRGPGDLSAQLRAQEGE